MSEAVWYYTMNGDRQGPVTLDVLQTLVSKERVVGDDLVWKAGMEHWMPAGDVMELRGAAAAKGVPAGGVVSSPVTTEDPGSVSVEQVYEAPQTAFDMSTLEDPPKVYGGIGRLAYFVIPMIVLGVGSYFVYAMLTIGVTWQVPVALLVLLVILGVILPALSRLKNLGMSRWNFLWSLVPIMNIWIKFRMFACPEGYQDHKVLDKTGKVLAVIYAVFLLLYVGAFAVVGVQGGKDGLERMNKEIEAKRAEEKAK